MVSLGRLALVTASILALAACSAEEGPGQTQSAEQGAAPTKLDIAEAPLESEAAIPSAPAILPRMAYVFENAFRLPGDEIAPLQARHADMCEALGPGQCMIVGMTASGSEDQASGRLELAVEAGRARSFATELSSLAAAYRGEQVSAQITGEDLSKSLVDTEAHLRSRAELRDRLLEVLATRRGTVEELVEAERQVAAINQEIDQARSWIAEMQGRVNYARVVLNYESSTPAGSSFIEPVAGAFGSLESILGNLVALIVLLSGVLAPFVLAGLGIRHVLRRREAAAVG